MSDDIDISGIEVVEAPVPWAAGMAVGGRRVYVDPGIPTYWEYEGQRIEVRPKVVRHEATEYHLMVRLGWKYLPAHDVAIAAEHTAVRQDGGEPAAYDRWFAPILAEIQRKSAHSPHIPRDLYRQPYIDMGQEALLEPGEVMSKGGRSVVCGDEVYYKKDGAVRYGRVLAAGEHGFTADCGGERHKVLHKDYTGHRARSKVHAKPVDVGEDGVLGELEDGRPVFLRKREPEGEKVRKALFLVKR